MAEEKKKLSWEELMAQITDPNMAHAIAAKFGKKFADDVLPPSKKIEAKKRPELVLPEDGDQEKTNKALIDYIKELTSYMDGRIEERTTEVRGEMQAKESAKIAKEIQQFKATHNDFDKYVEDIDALWVTGRYTLEECYKKALKANGISEEGEKKGTKPQASGSSIDDSSVKKVSSIKSSEEAGSAEDDKTPKYKTLRDAVKANYGKITTEHPEYLDSGEDAE